MKLYLWYFAWQPIAVTVFSWHKQKIIKTNCCVFIIFYNFFFQAFAVFKKIYGLLVSLPMQKRDNKIDIPWICRYFMVHIITIIILWIFSVEIVNLVGKCGWFYWGSSCSLWPCHVWPDKPDRRTRNERHPWVFIIVRFIFCRCCPTNTLSFWC